MTMKATSILYSLQMMRAFAAALVLLAHSQNFLHARNQVSELNQFFRFGSVGVDVFFVISGFIMVLVSKDKFQTAGSSLDFIIRRIIRVVPIYWFYTCLITGLLIIFPQYFSDGKQFDLMHFVASMLFIPWENNIGLVKPVLGVGWTLNSEMYFYLIFSFLLLFPLKKFVPLLASVLFIGVLGGYIFKVNIAQLAVVTSPLVIEFLIGSVIGVIFINNTNITKAVSLSFICIGLIGFILTSTPLLTVLNIDVQYAGGEFGRVIRWGIPASCIVFGVINLERLNVLPINHFLARLGDSSYSLYLTHIFVINALGVVWIRLFHDYYNVYIAAAFILSIIVGHIAYLLLENPIINYLNGSYRKYKTLT